jgi:hypothetical protein
MGINTFHFFVIEKETHVKHPLTLFYFRKRNKTKKPPLVGEVIANFCG